MAFCSTSRWEAPLDASHRNHLLPAGKWFVPAGVKEADNGGSSIVERTKDMIEFLPVFSRSFMQICRPVL
jgi:hypothetical protein